jgi:N-acetylglutamate synthase-like GNAT family acetyltransferase
VAHKLSGLQAGVGLCRRSHRYQRDSVLGIQVKIRNYSVHDRQSCLQVLDGNTPEFFVPKDRDEFSRFLDNLPGPYFVIEDRELIVACGGWAMDAEEVAALTWGMVRRDLHRQGIGRDLLHYRLRAIWADGHAKVVQLRTVPPVQEFFARQGFDVVDVVPNGYGAGLDRVTMALQLRVAV